MQTKFRIQDLKTGKFRGEGGYFADVRKAYLFDTREDAEHELQWILQHELQISPFGLVLKIVEA